MKKQFLRILCIALVLCMAVSTVIMPVSAEDTAVKSIFDVDLSKTTGIYFKCLTNKEDFTSYEVGDEIVFTFTMYDGAKVVCAPYFHYTLIQDDGNNKEGYIDATTGTGVVKTVLTTPGSVLLKVWPADAYKRDVNKSNYPDLYLKMKSDAQKTNSDPPLAAGALAGAPEITTAVPEPADFDEYWAGELAKLDECAPTLRNITKLDISSSTYDYYDVEVNCIGDPNKVITGTTHVAGILTVPKGASAGSLKFALNFQGYGVTSAGKTTASGTATFSVCAHSILQLQDSTYYDTYVSRGLLGKGNTATDYGWSATENATASTSYFHDMLLRDVQAIRFLKKYFGEGVQGTVGGVNTGAWAGLWNGKDIRLSGGSQGGYQSIATAGLVPEVTEVSASIPWFGNIGSQTVNGKIKSGFQPPYAAGLLYLDTCYFAKRVRAKVDISAGAGDQTSPVTSVQVMFNSMTTDASLTFDQGRTHYQSITYKISPVQTKSLTLKPGDTYTLPFAVSSVSPTTYSKVDGNVLTALSDGTFTVNYTNGTSRVFNVKTPVAVTGVTLNKTEETLAVDETFELKATIAPAAATNQRIKWSSSDTNVVKVDPNGVVTAVGAGNATVTATTIDGGFTASCAIVSKSFDFIHLDGYQVRTEEYNGLRSYFSIDKDKIPTMAKDGYELVEYGTLFASAAKLKTNGDDLVIAKNAGTYECKDYMRQIVLYRAGSIVREHTDFICSVVNFEATNYFLKINSRAYAVFKDAKGAEKVVYFDYENEDYRSVSLEQITLALFKSGDIDATCISYIDIKEFELHKPGDHEVDAGRIF